MAERPISKSTYFLWIDPAGGTDYSNVVCLTSHDFNLSNSTINGETYCGPSSSPGEQTQTINLSGETLLDPDTGKISAPDIFTLAQDNTIFSWMIGVAVPAPGDFTKTGDGFFSSYTENYSATAKGLFSASISVDGDVVQTVEAGS